MTDSSLRAGKVDKVYNGRDDVETRIRVGKNALGWDQTSCRLFAANQARLTAGGSACNPMHMLR